MQLQKCKIALKSSPGKLILTLCLVALAALAILRTPANPVEAASPARQDTPQLVWEGRLISDISGLTSGGSIIQVSVIGVEGLPIEVSSAHGGWSATKLSGSKPELGPYAAEFAGLSAGRYIIAPQGTGATVTVEADGTDRIAVEFEQVLTYVTPTPVVPGPVSKWEARTLGVQQDLSLAGSVLRISVVGEIGLLVEISTPEGWSATGYTGSKPEYGDYVVEFAALQRGTYIIRPQGLDTELRVSLDGRSYVYVEFRRRAGYRPAPTRTPSPTLVAAPVPSPPAPAPTAIPQKVWAARLLWNTSEAKPTDAFSSAIQVSVIGLKGLPVEIRSGGWSDTALTGTKPECGEFCLEFAGLSGSTYTITPQGLGINYVVTVDGKGFAVVEFYQAPAQGGREVWSGRVVENISGGGKRGYLATIQVVVEGKKWLPVDIGAGGWRDTVLTGTKPECGGFCLEFGGLSPGTYVITPQGLGTSLAVTVDEGGFARVEFASS